MKHPFFFVIILLSSLFSNSVSPKGLGIIVNDLYFVNYPFDVSSYEVLDSSFMEITYNHEYATDNSMGNEDSSGDVMTLLIGEDCSKFYSRNLHSVDTKEYKNDKNIKLRNNYANYEVFTFNKKKSISVVNRIYYSVNKAIVYDEEMPVLKWKLEDGTKEILGYVCNKAVARFRGRTWTAWYALEIPVPSGPWKLSGLPGLILEASDSTGNYKFEAAGISNTRKPICLYDWNFKKMDYSKWKKFEKRMHEHPGATLGEGQISFYDLDGNDITYTWTVDYCPIEY